MTKVQNGMNYFIMMSLFVCGQYKYNKTCTNNDVQTEFGIFCKHSEKATKLCPLLQNHEISRLRVVTDRCTLSLSSYFSSSFLIFLFVMQQSLLWMQIKLRSFGKGIPNNLFLGSLKQFRSSFYDWPVFCLNIFGKSSCVLKESMPQN